MKNYIALKLKNGIGYRVQETYKSLLGNWIRVTNMELDAASLSPEVYIYYDYTTTEGKSGSEKQSYKIFVNLLRNN